MKATAVAPEEDVEMADGGRRGVVSQPSGREMMDGMLAAGGPTSGLVERARSLGRPGPLATSNNSVEFCERRGDETMRIVDRQMMIEIFLR